MSLAWWSSRTWHKTTTRNTPEPRKVTALKRRPFKHQRASIYESHTSRSQTPCPGHRGSTPGPNWRRKASRDPCVEMPDSHGARAQSTDAFGTSAHCSTSSDTNKKKKQTNTQNYKQTSKQANTHTHTHTHARTHTHTHTHLHTYTCTHVRNTWPFMYHTDNVQTKLCKFVHLKSYILALALESSEVYGHD